MGKINVEVKDNNLHVGIDMNEDGQEVVQAKLSMVEAVQEAFKRGDAVAGAKMVDFRFELTQMVIVIDSDLDGQNLLEIRVDFAEALDESGLSKSLGF